MQRSGEEHCPLNHGQLATYALSICVQEAGRLLPATIHKVQHHEPSTTQRLITVGDVHGCLDEFRELMQKVNFDQTKDILILNGDMTNKGPYSVGVRLP